LLVAFCFGYFTISLSGAIQLPVAQAIDELEARAEVGGVAGGSDDDTVPPNGFDDILNEICEETGLVSDVSDEEAW
jgi:hypothetical protein